MACESEFAPVVSSLVLVVLFVLFVFTSDCSPSCISISEQLAKSAEKRKRSKMMPWNFLVIVFHLLVL